ncbi:MAG: hypothetical protein OHK0022_30040 [Roseiflexaceae bacterium]
MFRIGKQLVCPYCLTKVRFIRPQNLTHCPNCKRELPIQYVEECDSLAPFFVQIFGYPRSGKTVFLLALTLMLTKMRMVWPRFAPTPATDATMQKVAETNEYVRTGMLPPATQLGSQEVYMMILRKMERWGGRIMVTRDCAGEYFNKLEVPIEQIPYVTHAPTTFMMVSLPDMDASNRTIDMLMSTYIETLMKNKVDFKRTRRSLVMVLSKGDKIAGLPVNLQNYLMNDPLWATVNSPKPADSLNAEGMQTYIETMSHVSDTIREWLLRRADAVTFMQLAEEKNIDVRYALISSTGSDVEPDGYLANALEPRRVLDPYFWALELQSQP